MGSMIGLAPYSRTITEKIELTRKTGLVSPIVNRLAVSLPFYANLRNWLSVLRAFLKVAD
jgi:hypothetical protein